MQQFPVSFEDRSKHNLNLAKDCITLNKDEYWIVLTTRLYYAFFLKAKDTMYEWYKMKIDEWEKKREPIVEEEYFFNHKEIFETIKKYVSQNNKILTDFDMGKLSMNIATLKKYRYRADYEDLPMPINLSSYKGIIQKCGRCDCCFR